MTQDRGAKSEGMAIDSALVRELAELVIEMTGARSRIECRPLPTDDPMQRCPDITVAREKLKWEPKVALDDGLTRTIAYFDDLLRKA